MPGNTEISGRTRTSKRQWQWQLLPHHFTQLIVCLLVIVSSAFNGYSEVTLHELARASSLSYLSLDKIPTSPYYDKCNLEPLTQVVDPISKSGATIFRVINNNNDNKQIIVIACRGTANLSNFGTNLQFKLVEATQLSCDYVPDDARVHEGFQTASLGLWKKLSQPLLGQVVKNAATSVVFTGHSLGGATALLCATHFRASNGDTQQSPDVVTFGGPKLCNASLSRHLRNAVLDESTILHIVHKKDPILASNKKLWEDLGFENVGIELECNPYDPDIMVQEGGKEAKKQVAWNLLDHCKYMVRLFCV